jgi:hypothetical protein
MSKVHKPNDSEEHTCAEENINIKALKAVNQLKVQALPNRSSNPFHLLTTNLPYFSSIISILTCALVFYGQNMR